MSRWSRKHVEPKMAKNIHKPTMSSRLLNRDNNFNEKETSSVGKSTKLRKNSKVYKTLYFLS